MQDKPRIISNPTTFKPEIFEFRKFFKKENRRYKSTVLDCVWLTKKIPGSDAGLSLNKRKTCGARLANEGSSYELPSFLLICEEASK